MPSESVTFFYHVRSILIITIVCNMFHIDNARERETSSAIKFNLYFPDVTSCSSKYELLSCFFFLYVAHKFLLLHSLSFSHSLTQWNIETLCWIMFLYNIQLEYTLRSIQKILSVCCDLSTFSYHKTPVRWFFRKKNYLYEKREEKKRRKNKFRQNE